MAVVPQYWLRADVPSGPIQLVVPGPELRAILTVLHHNGATSVSYALEVREGYAMVASR